MSSRKTAIHCIRGSTVGPMLLNVQCLSLTCYRCSTINGERVYEHLSDGTWWATAEEKAVPGDCKDSPRRVFPISLYLDETKVTMVSNQQAKPLFAVPGECHVLVQIRVRVSHTPSHATPGILCPESRGATEAWVLIGFIPTLRPASEELKKDPVIASPSYCIFVWCASSHAPRMSEV